MLEEGDLRLVDGVSMYEGRVEVCKNENGVLYVGMIGIIKKQWLFVAS